MVEVLPSSVPGNLSVSFGRIIQKPDLLPGEEGIIEITVTNEGDTKYRGPVSINLFASTDNTLEPILNQLSPIIGAADPLEGIDEKLGTIVRGVSLDPGESRTFTIDFSEPTIKNPTAVVQGLYYLLADLTPGFPPSFPLAGADISTSALLFESEIGPNALTGLGGIATRPKTIDTDTSDNLAAQVIAVDDPVLQLNSILLNIIQLSGTGETAIEIPDGFASGTPPFLGAYYQAITHIAIADAVAAITGAFEPHTYISSTFEAGGASIEAAVIEAGITAIKALYIDSGFIVTPELAEKIEAELAFQRERLLTAIPEGEAKDLGLQIGKESAEAILAARAADDAVALAEADFTPGDGPYDWRPPEVGSALGGSWGELKPFIISSVEDFAPELLYEFGSDEYAADLNATKAIGEKDSTVRSPDQTLIAQFWAVDRPDTTRPPGQLNDVAQELALNENNTVVENARLFALLNLAQVDASITAWFTKYRDLQPRPIQAIRESAALDGRDDTVADPEWTPLLDPTPPFPDHISGHGTFAGSSTELMRLFFGTDNLEFDVRSQDLPGIVRTFNSITEAGLEDALSRFYGGVHTPIAVQNAFLTGQGVAEAVFDAAYLPTAEYESFI